MKDLRAAILKEHSKPQAARIANWIGKSQTRFDQLFKLFLNDEYRVVQRSAWPLSIAVLNHPPLIQKHYGPLIKKMLQPGVHDAVKRNALRLLQDLSVPARHQGPLMDACFRYIADPKEKAAIKAFSLTILEHLAQDYPDIRPELKSIIEDRFEDESPAFRSRARKILRRLG